MGMTLSISTDLEQIANELQAALAYFDREALSPTREPDERRAYAAVSRALHSFDSVLCQEQRADMPGEKVGRLVDAQESLDAVEHEIAELWGADRRKYLDLVSQWRDQIVNTVHDLMKRIRNPFYYGRAIREPERFVGRKNEMQAIYQRVVSGGDCALVGERRIGKSSLLRQIVHPQVEMRNGLDARRFAFVHLDCQGFPGVTRVALWKMLLEELALCCQEHLNLHSEILTLQRQDEIDNHQLLRLMQSVNSRGRSIVFLFDEFEALTANPELGKDFYGGLRFLGHNAQVNYVVTVQRPLLELQYAYPETVTFPFFNTFQRINLGLFAPAEVEDLLNRSLNGTGIRFTAKDRVFLDEVAGRHPFFFQMAAYHLFAAYTNRYLRRETVYYPWVEERLRDNTAEHWRYYWDRSENGEKLILAILSLVEQGRVEKHKLHDSFDARMLARLYERSLLQDRRALPTIFSRLFVAWIVEELSFITSDRVQDLEKVIDEIEIKGARERWVDTTERLKRGFARIDVPAMVAWLLEDNRAGAIVDLLGTLLQLKPPGP